MEKKRRSDEAAAGDEAGQPPLKKATLSDFAESTWSSDEHRMISQVKSLYKAADLADVDDVSKEEAEAMVYELSKPVTKSVRAVYESVKTLLQHELHECFHAEESNWLLNNNKDVDTLIVIHFRILKRKAEARRKYWRNASAWNVAWKAFKGLRTEANTHLMTLSRAISVLIYEEANISDVGTAFETLCKLVIDDHNKWLVSIGCSDSGIPTSYESLMSRINDIQNNDGEEGYTETNLHTAAQKEYIGRLYKLLKEAEKAEPAAEAAVPLSISGKEPRLKAAHNPVAQAAVPLSINGKERFKAAQIPTQVLSVVDKKRKKQCKKEEGDSRGVHNTGRGQSEGNRL